LENVNAINIYIDGADDFGPLLCNLLKGGGGALLREKNIDRNNSDLVINPLAISQKEGKKVGGAFKITRRNHSVGYPEIELLLKGKRGLQP